MPTDKGREAHPSTCRS